MFKFVLLLKFISPAFIFNGNWLELFIDNPANGSSCWLLYELDAPKLSD